jgi:type VI secretion system protein
MPGRGLLSRLDATGLRATRAINENDSVIEHLRVLLNARRGASPSCPEFGIPDFTDFVHQFPGAIQMLQRAIRESITAFEPRLRQVAVRHVPSEDPLTLRFEITAQTVSGRGGKQAAFRFNTQMSPGGRINVW